MITDIANTEKNCCQPKLRNTETLTELYTKSFKTRSKRYLSKYTVICTAA